MEQEAQPRLLPEDEHNRALQANAHPAQWRNPTAGGRYNLVIIGAGTAGLVAASAASALGARVALIEGHLMGGDCLVYGCVPSKAIVRSARAWSDVRDSGAFGVRVPDGARVDFPAVMERMRRLRARISPHDSAARFDSLGVQVFLGQGRFTGRDTVEVAGQKLRFARALIATGARAAAPPIPGLGAAGYLTNETIFSLTTLPGRLAVIGAGPIGCEMAQTFARFGAKVHLIEKAGRVLPREDRQAADVVQAALARDGVSLHLSSDVIRADRPGVKRTLTVRRDGADRVIEVDEILVGVGRAPNVDDLGLEAAGVVYDRQKGVSVDRHLRTTNRRIYAAGDVSFPYKFTHAAEATAAAAVQNALFAPTAKTGPLTIPWCTYTDPEVAHVGLGEEEAVAQGLPVKVFERALADVDRAVLDGEEEGFVRIVAHARTDRVLGATIVARHAGEMLGELTLAVVEKLRLASLGRAIHPYPTQAEAIRRAARARLHSRLTPRAAAWTRRWLALRRGGARS